MLIVTGAFCAATIWRVAQLYESMQPVRSTTRERIMPESEVGALSCSPLARRLMSREVRIGFWLTTRSMLDNAAHRMRCLYPLNVAIAVALVGLLSGQFANPMTSQETSLIALPVLSVYLLALAVPVIVLNLTFSEWHTASWVLRSSPVENPYGIALGGAVVVQLLITTPACLILAVGMGTAWGDPVSALLHGTLAWTASWLAAVASLAFAVPDLPLSLPAARGGSLGTAVVPLAGISCVASFIGGLHVIFASRPEFWVATFVAVLVTSLVVSSFAKRRLNRFAG